MTPRFEIMTPHVSVNFEAIAQANLETSSLNFIFFFQLSFMTITANVLFFPLFCSPLIQVHIRVASPPVKYPCYMGINIPTKDELVANRFDANSLAKHFGADSIVYLTVDGLRAAVTEGIPKNKDNVDHKSLHCTACLTGQYPVELDW